MSNTMDRQKATKGYRLYTNHAVCVSCTGKVEFEHEAQCECCKIMVLIIEDSEIVIMDGDVMCHTGRTI